uniref:Dual oxidase (inferred by orthology to a D. melanogaster protein) n=1 Tax=Anisakis simplex TaxID=6269 RepID=A0A0M3K700_ANISI
LLFRKRNNGTCEFRTEIGGYPALRLCQNWWNAQDIVQEYSVDEIVLGMASQISEREDSIVVEDLRGPKSMVTFLKMGQMNMLKLKVFFWKDGDPCPQPFQVNTTGLEPCIPFMRFDHFTGNEVTYIFSCIALGIIPLVCIGIGYLLIQKRKKMGCEVPPCFKTASPTRNEQISAVFTVEQLKSSANEKEILNMPVIEWINDNFCRAVALIVDVRPSIRLEKRRGGLLRYMDLDDVSILEVTISEPHSNSVHGPFVLFSVPKHYDVVVRLQSDIHCKQLIRALSDQMEKSNKQLLVRQCSNQKILEMAETQERRQKKLDHFFREAYSKAFNAPQLSDHSTQWSETVSKEVLGTTVTKAELADALGMKESDLFVERMFACMTGQHSTQVTFQEFLDVVSRFTTGSLRNKLELIFDMCDRSGNGRVEKHEFIEFVKSLNDAAGVRIEEALQDHIINSVLETSGIHSESTILSYKDFESIFNQIDDIRRPVGVHMRGAKLKINLRETDSLNSFAIHEEETKSCANSCINHVLSYLETYRQHIVILFMFTAINLLLFFERFWHYRYETEHRDLRRVMGVGIAITRGAAASLSFCMGLILTTVCRNVITILRETPLGEYVPFDSAITFHKIVAILAGFWAAVHTVGHCINFYHVATQSQDGLQCLFREAVFGSNFLPSISYWFYGTLTGITGILLVAIMSIIYVFSAPAVQSPKFSYYIIGPTILLIIDRIIGMRQQYKKLQILRASILPSDIIYIEFKRPHSFRFRSGQWVQVSCPAFSCTFNEVHAFSLASAPQAPTLELYIKAVGPWTWNLRNELLSSYANNTPLPVLHINGPYGDGNQDWHQYEVAVLIGGGIGITPYASTLTDLVLEKSSGKYTDIKCRKVYFIWICPTHKNYEWFIDVLKNVEQLDKKNILETHIFVTQFFHKFDLRTTMLYICEKHFRGSADGRSMFTGLKASNHFGRPNFAAFFKFLHSKHKEDSGYHVRAFH